MTKLNTAIFVFTMALTMSGASLYGQDGVRTAALTPIAPSLKGLPTVVQGDLSETVSGDLSSDLGPLSLGDETIGSDYFDENVVGHSLASDSNRVFGINVLSMSRANFNDSRIFDGGLSSGDVTLEDRGGFELFLTNRNSRGLGWELRYFGVFGGSETNSETFFPSGASASLTRDGDIHNVEVNYLRQAEGPLSYLGLSLNEVIFGVRFLQFNDGLDFSSNFSPGFRQRAENSLFGLQIGRRLEKQFGYGIGFAGVGKIGVYNNNVDTSFSDSNGLTFTDSKDDVAFLGELDLALTYAFKPNARAKIGYRALAAAEVGISERQSSVGFPQSFTPDSNGDLFIEGGYIGLEFVR